MTIRARCEGGDETAMGLYVHELNDKINSGERKHFEYPDMFDLCSATLLTAFAN